MLLALDIANGVRLPPTESSQGVHVFHQAAFQIGSFVAVDAATLCQPVNHADNFRQKRFGFGFFFKVAQVFNRCSRRFFVVTVLQTTFFVLANTFQG